MRFPMQQRSVHSELQMLTQSFPGVKAGSWKFSTKVGIQQDFKHIFILKHHYVHSSSRLLLTSPVVSWLSHFSWLKKISCHPTPMFWTSVIIGYAMETSILHVQEMYVLSWTALALQRMETAETAHLENTCRCRPWQSKSWAELNSSCLTSLMKK